MKGSLAEDLYVKLMNEEDARVCRDISDEACREVPLVILVLSVALFLSSLTGPILAGFLSMALFILGRSTAFIHGIIQRSDTDSSVDAMLTVAWYVLPDYHLFAVSGAVQQGITVHGNFFTWGYVGYAMGYAAFYAAVMLGLTILRFRRKDFV